MSKAIRWQIPFVSIGGTHYRIDIYDEQDGSWSGVQTLIGGETPFETDEDNSDDFFHPIRTQSGTLQVCTLLPGTTDQYITLDDLLPANNIARPVRLLNLDNSNAIEWQGFLSCEAYSQDYTGIPQILDLSLISVLEAMDSVFLDTSLVTGLQLIRKNIYYALTEIDRQCSMDIPFFGEIYYSKESSNIMTKMLDATILYDINEYTNEEAVTLIVSGMSCKQALERICQFMGWTLRENARKVYFQRINEVGNVYSQGLGNFGGSNITFINSRREVSITTSNIYGLLWMGTGHKMSVEQGSKSVEVVAKLEKYEFKLGLPEFPTENMIHSNEGVIEAYVTMDHEFNNSLTFAYYNITVRQTSGGYDVFENYESDVESAYGDCILSPDCDVAEQYPDPDPSGGTLYVCKKNVGAFFGRFNFSGEWTDGLYIVAANEMGSPDHAPTVFKMDSIISYRLIDGTLKLRAEGFTIASNGTSIMDFARRVKMKLRFGTLYWNGSGWQSSETYFTADFSAHISTDQEQGDYWLDIPINSQLTGSVSLEVCGSIDGGIQYPQEFKPFYDLLLTKLSLEYKAPEYITESDRSENKYYRLLGTNFRDEISVSTELASNINNRPSPSMVMDNITTPMQYLNYITQDGSTFTMRPEVELLNRLSAYYGAARQRLELEVAHISTPLPLLKLNGINNGKVYLPLSESRDWQMDKSTILCFETIN